MHNLQSFSIAIYLLCLALCVLLYGKYRRKGAQSQLPPGPRPFRIVGNIKDVPTTHEWLRFTEWSKAYGDVVYIHVLGNPLVILSSTQAAKDLLEARSAIYSCRPRFPMISELMGWDWAVQFMPYGARFKKFRKSVQNNLHQQAIVDYRPMIQSCADCLLDAIYSEPDAFLDHISHGVGNLMISVIYGVEDNERRERYIHNADKAIEGLIVAGNVGTFLVDVIPALKYIPEWFPGASFKQKARKWRRLARDMIDLPYEHAYRSWSNGSASSSIVKTMLSNTKGTTDPELIKGTAGVLYLGGADTQLSILFSFVLMMLIHPDVQRRAQAEIDEVIGKGQRPSFDDKQSLPYLLCIYLETLRWYPAVPLSVPHRVTETDHYKGFRIPRGSSVLVNQWSIFRDESNYKEASKFNPDRFLHQDEPSLAILDPRTVAFGFGRRKCPGRLFAEDAIWMIMASILSKFNITNAKDERGDPIIPEGTYCSSLISRPEPFKADFQLRV